jgi:hypothetical protein
MLVYMFFSMMIIHLFIMPYVMIASPHDFRLSLNGVYMALFASAAMVAFEGFVHPLGAWTWSLVLTLLLGSFIAIRWQLGISDAQYLRDMIPHHSMAVVTSRPRAKRTKNPALRSLATSILNTQEAEIEQMKKMLA